MNKFNPRTLVLIRHNDENPKFNFYFLRKSPLPWEKLQFGKIKKKFFRFRSCLWLLVHFSLFLNKVKWIIKEDKSRKFYGELVQDSILWRGSRIQSKYGSIEFREMRLIIAIMFMNTSNLIKQANNITHLDISRKGKLV